MHIDFKKNSFSIKRAQMSKDWQAFFANHKMLYPIVLKQIITQNSGWSSI